MKMAQNVITSDYLINVIKPNKSFFKSLTSYELYKVVVILGKDDRGKSILNNYYSYLVDYCTEEFCVFDYFTLLTLCDYGIQKEKSRAVLEMTANSVFSTKTLLFLRKTDREILSNVNITNQADAFNYIFNTLKTMETDRASIITFDMSLFSDFKKELHDRYLLVDVLISAYQKYNPEVVANTLFKGSSIIGKLLQNGNQYVAEYYAKLLLRDKKLNSSNVKMIGGGGSNLVFKIGNSVLKLGETRNCRKVYINHRILASQVRKLIFDKNQRELFYVEIMKYVKTGDVTEEEMQELKSDLYSQGLVWDDAKLENCGILDNDDKNESFLEVDYIDVAGNINYPTKKEEFMQRKRKVVVIDNDNISFNSMKTSG